MKGKKNMNEDINKAKGLDEVECEVVVKLRKK